MAIIVTLEINKKQKNYDLSVKAELTQFKRIITLDVNQKNIVRLCEAERQLRTQTNMPREVGEQFNRITDFLEQHVPPQSTIPPADVLITDTYLFPRSEYYTRFHGSTAFNMKEPAYWGSYHRSEATRFFAQAGGRRGVQFASPCVKKTPSAHSFPAHTGGYHSPFHSPAYSQRIHWNHVVPKDDRMIRDDLLHYKNRLAALAVTSFEQCIDADSKLLPRVYTENNYPCILVNLPILNPEMTHTEAARYWQQRPKPFQRLLMASFIAIINVEAIRANIPIEMVLRSSFGHNLPSVCETENTFRINVGLIPTCYAQLIGKALYQLHKLIKSMTDKNAAEAPFDSAFLATVRTYNAIKLKKAIDEKPRYWTLKEDDARDLEKMARSSKAYERIYEKFKHINSQSAREGKAQVIPVRLEHVNVWQAIRCAGDSMGKSILDNCFREPGTEDWFANQVFDAILAGNSRPIETALVKLLECLQYGETASMNYQKIHRELQRAKITPVNRSFTELYSGDEEFSKIVQSLCDALLIQKPTHDLYASLERGGTHLLTTSKSRAKVSTEPDYGSDSEFSDAMSDDETKTTKNHISHFKRRVCAGMKAILLAQYTALHYLQSRDRTTYDINIQQMYYEVKEAIQYVDANVPVVNKVRASTKSRILHFDLNHCNAKNEDYNPDLNQKLNDFSAPVVILDYTSSTSEEVERALRQCFSFAKINVVILVNSGLKNNQGGLDMNPYGEIRICTRDRKTNKQLANVMLGGLSEEDKLTQKAHEMVRVCKNRGLAFSLHRMFNTMHQKKQPEAEHADSVNDIRI